MAYQLEPRKTERANPVITRPGFAAPNELTASADLEDIGLAASFTVRVASGGAYRVVRLEVRPRDAATADAITVRALRAIRLDQLAREAVARLERPVVMRDDWAPGAFQIRDDPERIWADHGSLRNITNPEDQIWRALPVPGRGATPQEQAEIAARLYAEAVADGSRAPTLAVARQLHCSRSQASRMIRSARDLGLLSDPAAQQPPPGTE